MPRLFVAVWPPDDVLDLLEGLDRPALPGVRWTTRDQWHCTLQFLGDVDEERAVDALARVEASPTSVVLGPEVAMLGTGVVQLPAAGLGGLASAVGDAFADIVGTGDRGPSRPFHGHLTLARVRPTGRSGRSRRHPLVGTPCSATFGVESIALVRSRTGAGGARYEDLGVRWLGAPQR